MLALAGLTAAVFIVDLLTPLGVVDWGVYLPLILACVWLDRPRQVVVAAVVCSALVVAGFFLSPPGVSLSWGLVDRALGLITL